MSNRPHGSTHSVRPSEYVRRVRGGAAGGERSQPIGETLGELDAIIAANAADAERGVAEIGLVTQRINGPSPESSLPLEDRSVDQARAAVEEALNRPEGQI